MREGGDTPLLVAPSRTVLEGSVSTVGCSSHSLVAETQHSLVAVKYRNPCAHLKVAL